MMLFGDLFGFTEQQISWFGLTFGLTAFMLYMLFIIGQIAYESKAGLFGTFVLFLEYTRQAFWPLAIFAEQIGFTTARYFATVFNEHYHCPCSQVKVKGSGEYN